MQLFKRVLCLMLSLTLALPAGAKGDYKKKVTICYVNPEDPSKVSQKEIYERDLEYHEKRGSYLGDCNDDDEITEICYVPKKDPTDFRTKRVREKQIKSYLNNGCYIGKCDHKVTICKKSKNLEVDRHSLKSHLKNGAHIGYCEDTPDDKCNQEKNITLCQYPNSKNKKLFM